jgi:hypothetical protein
LNTDNLNKTNQACSSAISASSSSHSEEPDEITTYLGVMMFGCDPK